MAGSTGHHQSIKHCSPITRCRNSFLSLAIGVATLLSLAFCSWSLAARWSNSKFSNSSSSFNNNSSNNNRQRNKSEYEISRNQRVVFLAGPRETGVEVASGNLYRSSHAYELKQWLWPTSNLIEETLSSTNNETIDTFQFFVEMLQYERWAKSEDSYQLRIHESQEEEDLRTGAQFVRDEYEISFLGTWVRGKSIVFGTPNSGVLLEGDLIDSFFGILPWNQQAYDSLSGDDGDVTVVINYRSSRFKHLIAVLDADRKKDNITLSSDDDFRDYFFDNASEAWNQIDSLRLAHEFVQREISVIFIDIDTIADNNMDLSHVLICNVLEINCQEKDFPFDGNTDNHHHKQSSSQSYIDDISILSTNIQNEMEMILQEYECQYNYLAMHPSVTFLYADSMRHRLKACKTGLRSQFKNASITINNALNKMKLMSDYHKANTSNN